jgi:hypothetical protein
VATSYPAGIDSLPRPAADRRMDDGIYNGSSVIDNLSDAVEAIEGELGTDPAGTFATVKARLAAMDAGMHVVTWSGTAWRYRGATITTRPSVAAWPDAYVLWNTSLDATYTTAPPLAIVGDQWLPHGTVDPT